MSAVEDVFPGPGEMARLLRAHDWERSGLGDPSGWPSELRTCVRICLESRFPIVLWWGEELRLLYNDAWRPALGALKHPAIDRPGREVWAEIWHIIGPQLAGVMETGVATWSTDMLLPMDRFGYREETYWTYSYSPIRDDDGSVCGVFTPVAETTQRVTERFAQLNGGIAQMQSGLGERQAALEARPWALSLPKQAYAGTYHHAQLGDFKVTVDKDERMQLSWGRMNAVATGIDRPDHVRVEFVPNSGQLVGFTVVGDKVTGVTLHEMHFERK